MKQLIFSLMLILFTGMLFAQDTTSAANAAVSDINLIFVQGGWFTMGSDDGVANEQPKHRVIVDDFYIGKYEVTVGEFKEFIDATGYCTDADKSGYSFVLSGPELKEKKDVNWKCGVDGNIHPESEYNHPVIHVSWNDANAFCEWKGDKYRLPTEAEWEYAARGGIKSRGYTYSGSNDINEVGWYGNNSGNTTHPPGQKKPNELGIYDMTGNVWEYCNDRFAENYYSNSAERNPQGPESGLLRVLRGGSWNLDDVNVFRTSKRIRFFPDYWSIYYGFRIVRNK
jgi:formylglycine-generating enzyme required for sulfatase activity